MKFQIQRANVEDASRILELQRVAYESEACLYNDWMLPPMTQTVDQLIAEFGTSLVLKAICGEALIGSVRAKLSEATCQIGRLVVQPEFQRRGLGRSLMNAIEAEFPSAERFELFTGSRSAGNIRLYESLGYRVFRQYQVSAQVMLVYMEKVRCGE